MPNDDQDKKVDQSEKDQNINLKDEEMNEVSGGLSLITTQTCPNCGQPLTSCTCSNLS